MTRRLVNLFRLVAPGRLYSILDIGGNSSPLKHFLPQDTVVLLDVEPAVSLTAIEFRFDDYVRGSGAALPFGNQSFDIVTAHDTLEHVPPEFRQPFLEEVARVVREFVIIGGPLWEPDVVQAEARLDSFVRTTLQWEQPFLKEHIELGLPEPAFVEAFFRDHQMPFARVPSGNLDRWLAMQGLRHYLASLPDTEGLREELDRAYNRLYSDSDNNGVCYRQVYAAACTAEGSTAVKRVSAEFAVGQEESQAHLGALEGLLASMESHAGTMRDHLSGLHERIFRAEQETFEARNGRDEALTALRERETEVRSQQGEIAEMNVKLQAAESARALLPFKIYRTARRGLGRIVRSRKK